MEPLGLKDRLDIIAKFLGIFASIAGGFIWLNTYAKEVNQRLSDRQKETIRYHELYNGKEMTDAREIFAVIKAEVYKEAAPQIANFKSPQQADDEGPKLVQNIMKEKISKPENKTEIIRILKFFEQLNIFIEMNMCENESAKKLFKGDAYEIYYLVAGYVEDTRRRNPEFANGLQRLAYETGYKQ